MFRRMRWRIAGPYVLLIVLVTTALVISFSGLLRQAHMSVLEDRLAAEARLLLEEVRPLLSDDNPDAINDRVSHWAGLLDVRVTVIDSTGVVVGESHRDSATMDNHLYRKEIQEAFNAGRGSSVRYSQTLGYEMLYVAVPLEVDGGITHVVRIAYPLDQIELRVAGVQRTILLASVGVVFVGILIAVLLAERIALPLRTLTRVAHRLAAGDLDARLLPTTQDEVGELARAFNGMAESLSIHIQELTEQRSQSHAVLEHMADGVVITDGEGRVQLVNSAAARLLDVEGDAAVGMSFSQVARHHRIIDIWRDSVERNAEQHDLVDVGPKGSHLQIIATPRPDLGPQASLVIIQDLTRVRRLESMRRDFVSNISHELRTPLASLKALVETLRDGALDDPPAAQRFLDSIETEVDALTQMVQELLELSRIESGRVPLRLSAVPAENLIVSAVDRLRPQAERAGVNLSTELDAPLPLVLADGARIGQVVSNLVHNAIKFTPAGGSITVRASAMGDMVEVTVADTGVGIPVEDLDRIFERFYKVDRARRGGGTGLGLAIAKHIVQNHGGRIWATSKEGAGSVFSFTLPTAPGS